MPSTRGDTSPEPRVVDTAVLLGTAGIFLAALLGYAWAWGSFEGFVRAVDACERPFCDFVMNWLPMGRSLFELASPVGGYLYTAFFACLLVPFGVLSDDSAVALWGALQALVVALLFLLPCRRLLQASRAAYFVYVVAFATSLPILHNLKWGQVSTAMVLLVFGSALLGSAHPARSGALLALSASVKYYTGAFAVVPLLRRDARFLTAFVLVGVACMALVPGLLLGWEQTLQFTGRVFAGIRAEEAFIEQNPNSQYLVYVVSRWLGGSLGNTGARLLAAAGVAVLLTHFYLAARLADAEPRGDLLHPWLLVFLALPLVIRTSWPHYFCYLPLCQGLLAGRVLSGPGRGARRLALGLPIAASVLLASSVLLLLGPGYGAFVSRGYLLLANLILIPVAYAVLLPHTAGADARES